MIKVGRRAHLHEDRAGDPLDGLVNLFDLGIVLAVAFLLAALSSLDLTGALTDRNQSPPKNQITVGPSDTVSPVPSGSVRTVGPGTEVGKVYRLPDGRLIYVLPAGPTPNGSPS